MNQQALHGDVQTNIASVDRLIELTKSVPIFAVIATHPLRHLRGFTACWLAVAKAYVTLSS